MNPMHAHLTSKGLRFLPALTHPALLAPRVHAALASVPGDLVLVAEIQDSESDTDSFFHAFDLDPIHGANCVIVEAIRGENRQFAACVALGSDRIDFNGTVRTQLGARKVRMASPDIGKTLDMQSGGVTPLGLPIEWPILVDIAVAQAAELIIGSGNRVSKLLTAGKVIAAIPNAEVLKLTLEPRTRTKM